MGAASSTAATVDGVGDIAGERVAAVREAGLWQDSDRKDHRKDSVARKTRYGGIRPRDSRQVRWFERKSECGFVHQLCLLFDCSTLLFRLA